MKAKNNVRGRPHPTFYTKGINGELSRHTSPLKPLIQRAVPLHNLYLPVEGTFGNNKTRTKATKIIPQIAPEIRGTFNNSGNYFPPNLNLPMFTPSGRKLSSKNKKNVKNAYTGNPSTIFPIRFKRQSINSRNKKNRNKKSKSIRKTPIKGTKFG